jgi:nucleotide-binding universal stress UspA family protein
MQRIMAATDGSDGADRAVDVAAQLAKALNANLLILTVNEGYFSSEQVRKIRRLGMSPSDALESFTEDILKEASERARRLGALGIEGRACDGDPAEMILDVAGKERIDAIVIGRRGRGRLAGLVLGSVSQKLASLASCSVVVVP